jgi:hypothetical protein
MTEAEWLVCADPEQMLEFLVPRERSRGFRISNRKARLFEVACCRRIWSLIPDGPCREAVLVAERFADGEATDRERRAAANAARIGYPGNLIAINAGHAALLTTEKTSGKKFFFGGAASAVAHAASPRGPKFDLEIYQAAMSAERKSQTELARCVFGNPFRSVFINPAWITPDVRAVARTIYEEHRFGDMPILADALEEAGCTNNAVIAHCRGPGPHVRGCWVVDALLGKK